MSEGFICMACGFLRDSDNHKTGCLPHHNVLDWRCLAYRVGDPADSSAWCEECHKTA